MKEVKANIWDKQFDSYWRVIPINTVVKADGSLVMGAGLAKQAAERYPDLSLFWGTLHQVTSDRCLSDYLPFYLFEPAKLIGFKTKYRWQDDSDLLLIEQGLKGMTNLHFRSKCSHIVSPWLGCGLGGLNWERDVKPLVEKYFGDDDNFIIASL